MPILNWLSRDEDVKATNKVPYRLLEEVPELSYGDLDTSNMLIQGDNLDALKSLLPFYAGQVKCIYIDPPYNTKSAFEHYDDNLEHTKWLSMMWPRLELLRDFLTNDGYMCVSIDDNEMPYLKVIMDELFGRSNVKIIDVKMSESSGLKMGSVKKYGTIPKLKEYVLLAKKGGVKGVHLDLVPKDKWDTEYNIFLHGFTKEDKNLIDQISQKELITHEDLETLDTLSLKWELGSVAEETKRLGLKGKDKIQWCFDNAHRICQCATSSSVLKLTEAKKEFNNSEKFFVTNSKSDILYFVRASYSPESKKPRLQLIFAEDNLTTHPGDMWTDIKTTGLDAEGNVSFKNGKKPEALIARIIKMATNEGDIILDSFGGSGTTAAVAHKARRKWITIDIGEHAQSHIRKRLVSVIDGRDSIGASKQFGWSKGGGFRYFKLGASAFDETGKICSDINFPVLASHIWFSETSIPWERTENTPALGIYEGKAYALLYNGILGDKRPQGGNVLTSKTLRIIRDEISKLDSNFSGETIVYGESSRIGASRLKTENIVFKQTPYDVKAR